MKRVLEILIILLSIVIPVLIILTIPNIVVDKKVVINYNENFIDKYYSKTIFKDYTDDVIVSSNVDTSKVGKYLVNYKLKLGIITISNKKYVEVIDKKSPIITLSGNKDAIVCPNCSYIEEGYSAVDEYDGDITDKVEVIEEKDRITYRVSDSSNNKIEKVRNIIYEDKENPSITLKGNEELYIYKNSNYEELGYNAYDNCDGNITDKVVVTNNIDSSTVGNYEVVYSVTDSSNNTVTVKRIVRVINRKTYNYGSGNGKIYLTFDDGPSYLTSKILDILDKEGVKATFFVTSNVNYYSSTLLRAYNSNHTIGLHTYSHDYSYVYSSTYNYFSDLERISNAVYNITGKRSTIIRFPGGSSNVVSRRYNVGIMSVLTDEVVNRGYNYFDWNVDSNDAGGDGKNSYNIYLNVVNNLSYNKANVVLMHDSQGHEATVEALEKIITYAKDNGYVFSNLTDNTTPVRHGVNN